MPTFEWKGTARNGQTQTGVLVADSKDAVINTMRRQQIVVTAVKEKGKEIALPEVRRRRPAPVHRHLHAAVLRHDRRRSAAGAVPGDPRLAAGPQGLQARADPGAAGRRVGLEPRRLHAQASEGLQRPLHEHGRRRRGRRYSRHDPAAPGDLHRKVRQAELAGEVGR